ncbi:hypothetical protein LOTGIDRAFT_178238 [Lottia gigantea]|uniref:Sugar phosphate phosphatase n=1 Tax=Lottia gigantea TaxID=225164 RepID=V4C4D3_LOTGI|nr:hypothetical protein LOTGIDRAFT_178238 [Lottia gigantea]ESO96394.1 hypothetical protein LOTGIDRAFT_178238 [Lottia gigantea]
MAAENGTKEENALPPPLSAKFKESFAFVTIKDRLPVILSKVADTVHRKKNNLGAELGNEKAEDLKGIAGEISKLRYEIQTDKDVVALEDTRGDVDIWNEVLKNLTKQNNNQPPRWFSAAWLYLECYMYRRIQQSVELSKYMNEYDVFEDQKKNAYVTSVPAIQTLLTYLLTSVENIPVDSNKLQPLFSQLIQVALWGNKCDLSISASMENSQTSCILDQLHSLEPFILLNHTQQLWNHLQKTGKCRIDIVLDNAGFELITDLCLAEFLLSSNMASEIHFHGKAFPWFVSDVTSDDFLWTLESLASTNNLALSRFGTKWQQRIQDGTWVLHFDKFWTTPYVFEEMKSKCLTLHSELSKASLIIFKGDLNYRKLVGDLNWDTTVSFERSLQGFHPAPLVSLRALKCDVVVGLKPGQGEETKVKDESWMINGNWSVICFCDKQLK